MIISLSFLLISLIYFFVFLLFLNGWKKTEEFIPSKKSESSDLKISVVIACKNEEKQLPFLLNALQGQTNKNFQLILVNDHSTDDTERVMENSKMIFSEVSILTSTGDGKKNALKEGILTATGSIVLTTDADCIPSSKWIEIISNFFISGNPDLLICPVLFNEDSTFFGQIQSLEFSSLIASAAGSCGIGFPILCNGANLAVKRNLWLESFNEIKSEIASGDDMFLLQHIKKTSGKILFLKSKEAAVITETNKTLVGFIKQRIRWASKSTSYTDGTIIFVSVLVMSISLLQLTFGLLSLIETKYLIPTCAVWFSKFFIDYTFVKEVNSFFERKTSIFQTFVLSLIYPLYVIFIGFFSIFHKKSKW